MPKEAPIVNKKTGTMMLPSKKNTESKKMELQANRHIQMQPQIFWPKPKIDCRMHPKLHSPCTPHNRTSTHVGSRILKNRYMKIHDDCLNTVCMQ